MTLKELLDAVYNSNIENEAQAEANARGIRDGHGDVEEGRAHRGGR